MSTEEKRLGKITKVHIGLGGYQDVMLGWSLTLGNDGWGVMTPFYGTWCPGIVDPGPGYKWSEADRTKSFDESWRKLGETLRAAKKDDVRKLEGVPVEVTFDGNVLKDWRILTEVV